MSKLLTYMLNKRNLPIVLIVLGFAFATALLLSFGQRQVHYERFFASDPLTRARALASTYPKKEVTDRVLEFLNRDDHIDQ